MTLTILLILFFLLFTVLTFRNFSLAVLLYIGFLPSYLIRFTVGGVPSTLLEGMFCILLGVWILQRRYQRSLFLRTILSQNPFLPIGIALFLLAAFFSIFISPDTRTALGIYKAYFIEPILFFCIVLTTAVDKKFVINSMIALAWSAAVIAAIAIFQKRTGMWIPHPWNIERRVTSIYPFPNAVGLYLAPIIPLVIGLAIEKFKNKKKPIGYSLLAIGSLASLLAVFFAKSTGAIVGLLGSALGIGLWCRKTRSLTIGLSTAGILIFLFAPSPSSLVDELTFNDWSGRVRKTMWMETVEMLKDKPFFGAGLSGYPTAIAPYHRWPFVEIFQYPHNIILNFWTEMGILGLLGFCGIVISFFHAFKYIRTPVSYALSASMIVILIHGLVDVPYFKNDLAMFFWILMALALLHALLHVRQDAQKRVA